MDEVLQVLPETFSLRSSPLRCNRCRPRALVISPHPFSLDQTVMHRDVFPSLRQNNFPVLDPPAFSWCHLSISPPPPLDPIRRPQAICTFATPLLSSGERLVPDPLEATSSLRIRRIKLSLILFFLRHTFFFLFRGRPPLPPVLPLLLVC